MEKGNFADAALQELLMGQPAVLIGLIAHLVGTPLQDPIVRTRHRLRPLGQDILAASTIGAAGGNLDPPGDRLRDVV
jgi:hypothetical protein